MKNCLEKLKRVRFMFGKSSPLLKTALVSVVALSLITLGILQVTQANKEDEYRQLQRQAAILEQENAALQERVDGLGTAESIRQIAAEQLGLVDPNAIIIESE